MRSGVSLTLIVLSACGARPQQNPDIQVQLSLANGKDSYRGGEPITLELTFTARVPGYRINEITTQPASPVDQVVLSPANGVYPWLDDYSRERRYFPDYETSNELQPDRPVTIELPLNALYRFDELGRYTVHVVTSRISIGDFLHPKPAGPLTSNDVSFDTVPMDDTDEATNAKHIESLIRSARGTAPRQPASMVDGRPVHPRETLAVSSPERVLSLRGGRLVRTLGGTQSGTDRFHTRTGHERSTTAD